ncbi:MAG: hypothetical protein HQL09_03305 [Nitrospirae bacterium]|nr:hypothetical protein [Nitrospirota bacterium]
METSSICGLCLGRLKYQIKNAKNRAADGTGRAFSGRVLLESYFTCDPDEIVDILEIYHVTDRTLEGVMETLAELSCSASVLTRESLHFDFNEDGHLGLYLSLT